MSGHTPGPWAWTNLDDEDSCDQPVSLRGSAGDYVIEPYLDWSLEPGEGLDEWGMEISEANARLIAAAPDLLKALKRINRDWDGEPEDMQEVRELILRAEGTGKDPRPEGN